jgi:hypothetical protein
MNEQTIPQEIQQENNAIENSFEKQLQKVKGSGKTRGRPAKKVKRSPNNRPVINQATPVVQSAPIGAPLNDDSRANRPKRIPLSAQNRLIVPARLGFVRRWVNDVEDRIARFELAGWTKVENSSLTVGDGRSKDPAPLSATRRISVGKGVYAYLMEIPEEFYQEDQKAKHLANKERTQSMLRADPTKNQYGSITVNSSHKM